MKIGMKNKIPCQCCGRRTNRAITMYDITMCKRCVKAFFLGRKIGYLLGQSDIMEKLAKKNKEESDEETAV